MTTTVASSTRLSGLEFEMLWAAYGRDRMPYPLHYRTEITEFDELERHRDAALTTLLAKYSPELEHAIEVLLEPDARVESKGFGGPDLSQTYRFHGAVRDRMGAALTQLPGATADTGGDVLITYCTAQQVCTQAVDALPRRDPGTHPRLELRREEIAADRDRHIRRAHDHGPLEQLNRIFQRPRSALGEITIYAGPAVDARPTPGRGFWWMDYPDGRYYIKTGNPIIATPLDATAMSTEIHRLLTLTQRYHHEDRAHDEYLRSRH
ncbi:ESX secretion-associated protein EspG [Nocardia sp. NBC_00565]|uniref:ESX secretion-associated protein EspG n=1 Tax=Nocardia sp. NBC_00565 TaxID=2975993 RepID=UPI002E81A47E|nr:ESX secretion-associated protein EspG [Nocardia sp. NBC_00565]